MSTLFANTLISVLLPPFCFIVTGGIGLAVWRWHPRVGRYVVAASLAFLWMASTIAFNRPLVATMGWPVPVDLHAANRAQAIVVLGGGLYPGAREYGGADTVNTRTLARVRYGAWLVKQTGLPVLVSGGRPDEASVTEAEAMKSVLEDEFLTPVRWVEVESRNTFENARASARILRSAGVDRVILVTDSLHMRRAIQAFAPTGIEVVPAPVHLFHGMPLTFANFLPSPTGFQGSFYLAHEALGRVWYAVRERVE